MEELNLKDSINYVKDLLKRKKSDRSLNARPGNIVMFKYNAKDKEQTYDKTPLTIILRKSSKYTLGLNIHWCPFVLRKIFVNALLKSQKQNIKKGLPLTLDYKKVRPIILRLGMFPVIRLYINARMSKKVIKVEPNELGDIIRVKTETFTNGKYSAEQLYKIALQKFNSKGSKKKKRKS